MDGVYLAWAATDLACQPCWATSQVACRPVVRQLQCGVAAPLERFLARPAKGRGEQAGGDGDDTLLFLPRDR